MVPVALGDGVRSVLARYEIEPGTTDLPVKGAACCSAMSRDKALYDKYSGNDVETVVSVKSEALGIVNSQP